MVLNRGQFMELLLQMLETEQGGVKVYETSLRCVVNEQLRQEWDTYLAETIQHVEIVTELIEYFGGNAATETPGRLVVRQIGESLVKAMEVALNAEGLHEAAELVAAECVMHAETMVNRNWVLLREPGRRLRGFDAQAVEDALLEVQGQEKRLDRSTKWCRVLWIIALRRRESGM